MVNYKMFDILKPAGPQLEVLSVCRVVLTVQGYLGVCRCISDFSYFAQPCILKTTKVDPKLVIWGYLSVYEVLLTVKISKSI